MKLSEAAIGQRVVAIEQMGDEIRWWHYARRELAPDETLFGPRYLPVHSLRTVQGIPGQRPRYDSGEHPYPSQLPATLDVVDAAAVSHEWTEAHNGLMVVSSAGWTGIYVNSKLVQAISPYERPYHRDQSELLIRAFDPSIAVAYATATSRVRTVLPTELTDLRLRDIRPIE